MDEKEKSLFEKVISGEYTTEAKEDRYPKVGPFYYYKGNIIAPDDYQRKVNPVTFMTEAFNINTAPREHRDMWDKYMTIKYPELKKEYDDDHKALPRGRVDYRAKDRKLSFTITLDKCIAGQEYEVKRIYNLVSYNVNFLYGVLNYKCKDCR